MSEQHVTSFAEPAPAAGLAERATSWRKLPLVANERQALLVMGGMTLLIGMTVLVMVPAGLFGPVESVGVLIAALSTIPVAVAWCAARTWPRHVLVVSFVVYADAAVIFVLSAFQDHFAALQFSALLCLVALFAAIGGSLRLLAGHLVVSVLTMSVMAFLSVREGVSPWLVVARTVLLCLLFAVPIVLHVYVQRLRQRATEALVDPLTGLWNRRGLFDVLDDRSVSDSVAGDSVIGVIVIDIDRFKHLNDLYGHDGGDNVLCEVGRRLIDAGSAGAVVARVGGDEFVCVHRGSRTAVAAAEDRIRTGLVESFAGPAFTVSVGSATDVISADQTGSTMVRRLMALADIEMYRTKRRVTGDLRFDGADTDSPAPAIPAIRQRVRALIAAGGPEIVFQPVVFAASGKVVGYEALSRFAHGSGFPLTWFRDATVAGVAGELELAAIDNALIAMQSLPPDAFVSLNTSADTILTGELLARLAPHLAFRSLYLEFTEHQRVDNFDAVALAMEELRAAGVKLAIDDVGSGFASLLPIVELRPDMLKTDCSLMCGIDTDRVRRAAAAALCTFAHETAAVVLMEGVETPAQHRVAVEIGADYAQGSLYGMPAPVEAFATVSAHRG